MFESDLIPGHNATPDCSQDGTYRIGAITIMITTNPANERFMMVVYNGAELIEMNNGDWKGRQKMFDKVWMEYINSPVEESV